MQVVLLHALKRGYLDAVPVAEVAQMQGMMLQFVRRQAAAALEEIDSTKQFTATAERDITCTLRQFFGLST